MKLSYRGVAYEPNTTSIEFEEKQIGGKYRGQNWHCKYPRHIPHLKPKIYRQYRGIAYSTLPIPLEEMSTASETLTLAEQTYCRVYKPQRVNSNQSANRHLENMRRSLERRLAAAKAKGDKNLINMLEEESKQLSL